MESISAVTTTSGVSCGLSLEEEGGGGRGSAQSPTTPIIGSRKETRIASRVQGGLPWVGGEGFKYLESLFKEQLKTSSRGGRRNCCSAPAYFPQGEIPRLLELVGHPWLYTPLLRVPSPSAAAQSPAWEHTGWRTAGPPEAENDFQSAGGGWRFGKTAGWSSLCGQLLAIGASHSQCCPAELPRAYCRSVNKQTHAKLRPGDKWWGPVTVGLDVRGEKGVAVEDLV